MRRRITFVQKPDAPFNLDQASLTRDSLTIHSLDALREERITVSHDEVPDEIRQLLKHTRQLHIRWVTEREYESVAPFSSRISPGLHVFVSNGGDGDREQETICPMLKKVFGSEVDCLSTEKSFIWPPVVSKLFSSAADLQYHTLLPSPTNLITYLQENICAQDTAGKDCAGAAARLHSADSVDINYDGISHAVTLSAVWTSSPGKDGWTDTISKPADGNQIEVGLLGSESSASDPEDIKMGGLLGVVGRDTELKPTLFSFPSRHHPLPNDATYTVSFTHPTGLHPTMTISLSKQALTPPLAFPHTTCALHTYLTLPSPIFADKYQLLTSDPLFLSSHNLLALRSVAGETDLEAPDWSVDSWGSNWLFELPTTQAQAQNVTIPLHLRYLHPSASGYREIGVPWPVVFWACSADEGGKMGVNPFDRVELGWDALFGAKTMFYQVRPAVVARNDGSSSNSTSGGLVERIDVPVLQLSEQGVLSSSWAIEIGTVVAIVLGFGWVLWKLGLVGMQRKNTDTTKKGKDE